MPVNQTEIERRSHDALSAIKNVFGTEEDKYGVTMFASHHIEELEEKFWEKHLNTKKPEPNQVLDILVLSTHWGGEDDIDTFDFTLPEDVTDYVLSVSFDEEGKVVDITMES